MCTVGRQGSCPYPNIPLAGLRVVYPLFFYRRMSMNTNKPFDLENQVILMKKYCYFRKRIRMSRLLADKGYFRVSRLGKYLLSFSGQLGYFPNQNQLYELYDFDVSLRLLLFKYTKKAEIYFRTQIANAISIEAKDGTFYLKDIYYTKSKSETDAKTRKRNQKKYSDFISKIKRNEKNLRKFNNRYPELKEYRVKGKYKTQKIPSWTAFEYFEFGSITTLYSYLRGDLRKKVLAYGYNRNLASISKKCTKEFDTWIDAVRNLRNICSHHNLLVNRTSSIVLFENSDSPLMSFSKGTGVFSRIYALKKVLNNDDGESLKSELVNLYKKKSHLFVFIKDWPSSWETIYDSITDL